MINQIDLLDTETTGFEPSEGAALLEVAVITLSTDDRNDGWHHTQVRSALIEYEGVIPPESRAIHHISPAMVAPGAEGCYTRDHVIGQILADETDTSVFAAHNAAFDQKFLPELMTKPWICTWRCALHLFPDAPSYKNQVLRYYLNLEPNPMLLQNLDPHRALYDTACTTEILSLMLTMESAERLVELTTTPILQEICNFGSKHRGQPWSEVPRSYIMWMEREGILDKDMDLRYTADYHLGRL